MTDEEVTQLYNELKQFYGDRLVDFEYYPRVFMYQVRLYKYYKGR